MLVANWIRANNRVPKHNIAVLWSPPTISFREWRYLHPNAPTFFSSLFIETHAQIANGNYENPTKVHQLAKS